MNKIVLSKYFLYDDFTDKVKQKVYCDKKPNVFYTSVEGYYAALYLVGQFKFCEVASTVDKYRTPIKNCTDLLYNITRRKVIVLSDNEDYTGDDILCVFFADREKYSKLCRYSDDCVVPIVEYTEDIVVLSY